MSSTSLAQNVILCLDLTTPITNIAGKSVSTIQSVGLSRANGRLPFPLLDQVRGQVCRVRDGYLEAIRRDEQEWKR
jgi:hypothetical protein